MMPPGGIGAARRAARSRRTCQRAVLVAAATVLAAGCDRAAGAGRYTGIPTVIGDTLRYPDGSAYVSGFTNIEYIGSLPAATRAPFVIIAGHECDDCDAPPSVLMRSPADGPVRRLAGLAGWHPYPGRVIAYNEDSAVLSYSRLFWGLCLPERPPGLVEYRTEYSRGSSEPYRQVQITEIDGDSLIGWRRVATTRLLATTLVQVQAKECAEIPQRDIPAPP